MNKQELEKWIEQNKFTPGTSHHFQEIESIEVDDLRELLKTHAIVPREPSQEMNSAGFTEFNLQPPWECIPSDIYKAMIKASEG